MRTLHLHVLLMLAVCFAAGPLLAQDPPTATTAPALTLEDIFASGTFSSQGFQGGRWAEEGPVITFIESGDAGQTHLVSYNLETDAQTVVINGNLLHAPDVDRPIRIEGYQFLSDKSKALLYTDSERVWRRNTKGFYYVYDMADGTLTPISDRAKGFQMFAKFSPDGRHLAFVRDRNLFLVDWATMTETQLTDDGTNGGIINGTSDWVYEEEFGLRDGWAWSPDSRHLAFFQLDETNTRDFFMADLRGHYPEEVSFRYPKAGETNSEIRVGVIDVTTKDKRFFDTGTWKAGGDSLEYIPQMGWTPALDGTHHVWMFRLNRDQNDLDLLYANPASGMVQTVLEETSDTWIDAETGFSDLDVGQITYLKDGKHFVWISEKDGYRHLYLHQNDGTPVRPLTQGQWEVADFHGIANGQVYFTGTLAHPTQRQLYRYPMQSPNGTGPVQISQGAGWHNINMSSDYSHYIDTYSNVSSPTTVTLHRIDGQPVKVLQDNADLAETLNAYALPEPEFITVPGAAGDELNAWIIKPSNFNPNQTYPLLLYVYGGPGSQTVRNAWGDTRQLWHTMLAEELGIIVASVDNRGTGARGRAFKTATYKQLGVLEAQDQVAAAKHLGSMPYIDAERMAIWGWSYGGFMTLMSMMSGDGPDTFKAGVSVAPVSDWRQYDTIYTERFMSTPQKNEAGYEAGAPVNYADRLKADQRLLMVHGDLDDNVHFQNFVHMVDALQKANKQFDLMMYPGRNHGIYGGNTRLHLHTKITDFLKTHLKDKNAVGS